MPTKFVRLSMRLATLAFVLTPLAPFLLPDARAVEVKGEYAPRFKTLAPQKKVPVIEGQTRAYALDRSQFYKTLPDGTREFDIKAWGEILLIVSQELASDPKHDVYIEYNVKTPDSFGLGKGVHKHLVGKIVRHFNYLPTPIVQAASEMSYQTPSIERILVQTKTSTRDEVEQLLQSKVAAFIKARQKTDPKYQAPQVEIALENSLGDRNRGRTSNSTSEAPPVYETLSTAKDRFVFGSEVKDQPELLAKLIADAKLTDSVSEIGINKNPGAAGASRVIDFFTAIRQIQNAPDVRLRRDAFVLPSPGHVPNHPLLPDTTIRFESVDRSTPAAAFALESSRTNLTGVVVEGLDVLGWRESYPLSEIVTTYQQKGTPEEELKRYVKNTTAVMNEMIESRVPIYLFVPPNWDDPAFKTSVTSQEIDWLLKNIKSPKLQDAEIYFVVGAYDYITLEGAYESLRTAVRHLEDAGVSPEIFEKEAPSPDQIAAENVRLAQNPHGPRKLRPSQGKTSKQSRLGEDSNTSKQVRTVKADATVSRFAAQCAGLF